MVIRAHSIRVEFSLDWQKFTLKIYINKKLSYRRETALHPI